MPEDKWRHCVICDAQFHPNRWWQRYCSAFCCTEFHRRERQQMRQLWREQQIRMALLDEAMEVPADVEPLRRRL
jgi:predicted nucleic acid-binding Zn ribbon protein